MRRFLTAVITFPLVMFAQIFALAAAEGFGGMFIAPFGSRNALLVIMLGVALVVSILRAWTIGPPKPAAGTTALPRIDEQASRATSPAYPAATQPFAQPAPPAPPSRRALDMIAAAARQAIVFRQHFPPRFDTTIRSFFGGAPVAPRGFLWPCAGGPTSQGAPLHFLMQVDCTAVPVAARLGALPNRGVLYFFLDMSGVTSGGRVIHADASRDDWETVVPPRDLGTPFGPNATYHCLWAQTAEQCPVLLPKWTFDPVVIELPEPVREEEDDEGSPALWPERLAGERLLEAQGEPKRYDYLTVRDIIKGSEVQQPFPTFPHDWRALHILSGGLIRQADRDQRYPTSGAFREMEKDARDQLLSGFSAEAQSWFDRAASEPPFDEVPRTDREAFWELMTRHPSLTRSMLIEALTQSIETTLAHSARAASRVPSEIADRIRGRHALAVMTDSGIHANIPDRMLAPPVDVQGNQWERAQTHLLLLEVSSNEGLGHHFGEGVYQFWIRPEDLEAGRFDKVELTADAY